MSITAAAAERTRLTAEFTGKAVWNLINPVWQLLYACNCLWSTTFGIELYQQRFSSITRFIVRMMYYSGFKYWHWLVEIATVALIGGPPLWDIIKGDDTNGSIDISETVEVGLKIIGTSVILVLFLLEMLSLYVQCCIFRITNIRLCWCRVPGDDLLNGFRNNFVKFELSRVRTAGLLAETEQSTLLALCQSRHISEFTIMFYNDNWRDLFDSKWNFCCTVAKAASGLAVCVVPYSNLEVYSTAMGCYFLVVLLDFCYKPLMFCCC